MKVRISSVLVAILFSSSFFLVSLAKTGMTLTDAFNIFIQQSLNVEGLPFIVTKNSKEALREQAVAMLMLDLKRAEERAEMEGWIDADDLERELGVID